MDVSLIANPSNEVGAGIRSRGYADCPYVAVLRCPFPDDCSADARAELLEKKQEALRYLFCHWQHSDPTLNLANMDLCGLNLSGFHMQGVDLAHAKLSDANLVCADFQRANLFEANLRAASLIGACFDGANCVSCDFSGCDISGASFQNADMSGAMVPYGINLDSAEINSDVRLAYQHQVLQDGAMYLLLPDAWHSSVAAGDVPRVPAQQLSSVLQTINSMQSCYRAKQVKLMCELMRALRQAGVDFSLLALPLLEAVHKEPYICDARLAVWMRELAGLLLQKYVGEPMPYLSLNAFGAVLDLFSRHPRLMLVHNLAFIQLVWRELSCAMKHSDVLDQDPDVYAEQAGTAEDGEEGVAWLNLPAATDTIERLMRARHVPDLTISRCWQVTQLYQRYLALEEVCPYVQLTGFGDLHAAPDWADREAANYIVFSSVPSGPVMLLSESTLNVWLNIERAEPVDIDAWYRFYLYRGDENQNTTAENLEQLFAEHFPLFLNRYRADKGGEHLQHLLLEFGFDQEMLDLFAQAGCRRCWPVALTAVADQQKLEALFMPKLELAELPYRLSATHYQRLLDIYRLQHESADHRAVTLLALAAVFTRYASSAFFGDETDSPLALRWYAQALMLKSQNLAPHLFTDVMTQWLHRQSGIANGFSCADVLATQMVDYLRTHFPDVVSRVLPLSCY